MPETSGQLASLEKTDVERWREQLQLSAVDEMSNADLVLGHFNFNQISGILGCRNKFADFPDGQVVVFLTTTTGYPNDEAHKSQVVRCHERRRVLLFVRNMASLQNHYELSKVFSLSFDKAERMITKNSSACLELKDDPFFPPLLDYLSALAILCQGSLAVHAHKDKDGNWQPSEMVTALKEKMGWTKFMDEHQHGSELVRRDLEAKRQEVSQACWWLEDFGLWANNEVIADEDKRKAFEANVTKEWGGPLPETVQSLLDTLLKGNEVQPIIVAEAFCALFDKLETA